MLKLDVSSFFVFHKIPQHDDKNQQLTNTGSDGRGKISKAGDEKKVEKNV